MDNETERRLAEMLNDPKFSLTHFAATVAASFPNSHSEADAAAMLRLSGERIAAHLNTLEMPMDVVEEQKKKKKKKKK